MVTDAGCIGTSAPCAHSCSPVAASVILPVKAPRFGSASVSARVAASLSGVGLCAESATGLIPGLAVANAGAGGIASAASLERATRQQRRGHDDRNNHQQNGHPDHDVGGPSPLGGTHVSPDSRPAKAGYRLRESVRSTRRVVSCLY